MSLPDTSVKFFASTMSGAPALSGEAGKLVPILDACLVNGFGTVTVNNLVVASNVATVTVSAGHNFAMVGTTGPVIRIAGATPAGLNGDWRLASVPNSTTCTFSTTGIADITATGTITAARAPAGWEKRYSGTNKAAYARPALNATAMLLRVDDTPAQYPTLIMYEAMTGIDAGTGPAPTSGSRYAAKSQTANTTTRAWRLFADTGMLFMFVDTYNVGTWYFAWCFGDIISYKGSDAYKCVLQASTSANYYNNDFYNSLNGLLLSRAHTQTGAAIAANSYTHGLNAQFGGVNQPYPAPAFGGLLAWPVEVWDSMTIARGMMPGLLNPLHSITSGMTDGLTLNGFAALPGRDLFVQNMYGSRAVVFDVTGPWR